MYDELFTLSYAGNGGWNWEIAYNLPVHVRRYCLKLLQKAKEEEQNDIKEQQNSAKSGRQSNTGPVIVPPSVQSAVSKSKQRRKPK